MTVLRGWKYALVSFIIFVIVIAGIAVVTEAKAKSNKQIILELTCEYNKSVKIFDGNRTSKAKVRKLLLHRKGKPYVLVERDVSVSYGNYGLISGKWFIRYNKYTKPGKKVECVDYDY